MRTDAPITAELAPYQAARDGDERFAVGLAPQFDAVAALAAPFR